MGYNANISLLNNYTFIYNKHIVIDFQRLWPAVACLFYISVLHVFLRLQEITRFNSMSFSFKCDNSLESLSISALWFLVWC